MCEGPAACGQEVLGTYKKANWVGHREAASNELFRCLLQFLP